jgi:hypothetical protein
MSVAVANNPPLLRRSEMFDGERWCEGFKGPSIPAMGRLQRRVSQRWVPSRFNMRRDDRGRGTVDWARTKGEDCVRPESWVEPARASLGSGQVSCHGRPHSVAQGKSWLGEDVAQGRCGSGKMWLGEDVARGRCGSGKMWLGEDVARGRCRSGKLWLREDMAHGIVTQARRGGVWLRRASLGLDAGSIKVADLDSVLPINLFKDGFRRHRAIMDAQAGR